jgi:hypothetical protein
MLGHQTQRKAEDLIDAGMKSVVSNELPLLRRAQILAHNIVAQ